MYVFFCFFKLQTGDRRRPNVKDTWNVINRFGGVQVSGLEARGSSSFPRGGRREHARRERRRSRDGTMGDMGKNSGTSGTCHCVTC